MFKVLDSIDVKLLCHTVIKNVYSYPQFLNLSHCGPMKHSSWVGCVPLPTLLGIFPFIENTMASSQPDCKRGQTMLFSPVLRK